MTRVYPDELHLGQQVFVQVDPTAHPIKAHVTKIDAQQGMIHVHPVGSNVRWAAHPRLIRNSHGEYLHQDGQHFYYSRTRSL